MTMPIEKRESGFKANSDYKIIFEPSPRRVRVRFNGETVADSLEAHCCSKPGICRFTTSRDLMSAWT